MIARISGKLISHDQTSAIIDAGGICYEVLIPQAIIQRIEKNITEDNKITLITYHYLQAEPSKNTPVLIGFLNQIEKDFFLSFISVSGIGPRAAVKAIDKPISLIAKAIYEADMDFLRSLPGIGQQKARDIIAKLQNKIGKFGLMQDASQGRLQPAQSDLIKEAVSVLMQLEYNKSEAENMVKRAFERAKDIKTTEELLNEVYKQKKAI
ncbi:MAG: helix-hairpin-helix domain-containing protein [Candidatus Omnitrophica bacterium]|jgi:Holliday junction DNA helicase RuvA|nr:helix-hairpin-helix domain-containing protein [Candidatus Omnitrophota bacterium]